MIRSRAGKTWVALLLLVGMTLSFASLVLIANIPR